MRTFSSPSVTSSSEMPDSWTRSISFLSLRKSMLVSGMGRPAHCAGRPGIGGSTISEAQQREFECGQVAVGSESADHAGGAIGEIRVLTEGLARVDVRQVNLHVGDVDGGERVAQGDAG